MLLTNRVVGGRPGETRREPIHGGSGSASCLARFHPACRQPRDWSAAESFLSLG